MLADFNGGPFTVPLGNAGLFQGPVQRDVTKAKNGLGFGLLNVVGY